TRATGAAAGHAAGCRPRQAARLRLSRLVARLLADTEAGEDASQQVVGAESAGDFSEGLLRMAQIFGEQFAGAHQRQLRAAVLEVLLSLQQRLEMAAARAEAAFSRLLITHAGLQVFAQQIKAQIRFRRQA